MRLEVSSDRPQTTTGHPYPPTPASPPKPTHLPSRAFAPLHPSKSSLQVFVDLPPCHTPLNPISVAATRTQARVGFWDATCHGDEDEGGQYGGGEDLGTPRKGSGSELLGAGRGGGGRMRKRTWSGSSSDFRGVEDEERDRNALIR